MWTGSKKPYVKQYLDNAHCSCSGETAAGSFPVQAVQVMNKICRESEASLDYYALFKVCWQIICNCSEVCLTYSMHKQGAPTHSNSDTSAIC